VRRADRRVQQPGIADVGREQNKLTDGDDTSLMAGGTLLNVADLMKLKHSPEFPTAK